MKSCMEIYYKYRKNYVPNSVHRSTTANVTTVRSLWVISDI